MTDASDDAAREARARRALKAAGLSLRKSRAQQLHLNDQGGYMIVDTDRNLVIHGDRFQLDLDQVEAIAADQKAGA